MAARNLQLSAAEQLSALRTERYKTDGLVIELVELTAAQATAIWGELGDLEDAGRLIDVYKLLVLHGAHNSDGDRVFLEREQLDRLPVRHLVPMGEAMLRVCDMGLDSGNAEGDPAETLLTD